MTAIVLNTTSSEVEIENLNHDKYITTPEFNKLTAEGFAARLKQANLVTKTDFDYKLTSFSKRSFSNKTKHLEVQKKLDSLLRKITIFSLGRIYFTSNDGSKNRFVYQPIFYVVELKIEKRIEYINGWKSKSVYNSKLVALNGAFLPNLKYFGNKIVIILFLDFR